MNNIKLKNFIYKNFGETVIKFGTNRQYEYDGNESWDVPYGLHVYMHEDPILHKKPELLMEMYGASYGCDKTRHIEDEILQRYHSKIGDVYNAHKEFFEKVGAFIEAENEKIRLNEIKKLQEKENKEVEKALEALEHTMITRAEVSELLKDIGCAIFKKRFINVQEWANTDKTRYWIKASHTVKQIKCLTVNGLYSKEDILKAIA